MLYVTTQHPTEGYNNPNLIPAEPADQPELRHRRHKPSSPGDNNNTNNNSNKDRMEERIKRIDYVLVFEKENKDDVPETSGTIWHLVTLVLDSVPSFLG